MYRPSLYVGCFLLIFGWIWGIGLSPQDSIQGFGGKILYIHVPAAWMSLATFCMLGAASFVSLVWRLPLIALSTLSCARLSAVFTTLTLITGMLWAKPVWGTWWVWDARLTTSFLQLILTLGIISLHPDHNIWEPQRRNAHILAVVGLVNLPIIKGSVVWWNTLHQPPTFTFTKPWAIDIHMALPLLCTFIGYLLLTFGIISLDIRGAFLWQRIQSLRHRL